ncbi:MAG: diguanylate cyclase, partial [Christensenellaceae bacterium]
AVPIAQCVLAITFPWNWLYYTDITYVADVLVPHYETQGSVIYYIGFIYTYILTLCAVAFAIYYHRKGDALHKKQSAIIIVATAIPGIGNAFNVLGSHLLSFDITSLMLSGTCVLLGYSFLRLGLFQIAPIAREKIVETMQDAFVLADPHGRFIDANAAAKKLFPQLAAASIGTPIDSIEGIPWSDMDTDTENWTFRLQDELGDFRYYSISRTPVGHQNKTICNCIMIYDVTESKKLLDEVSKLAERDALTGLLNRGTFFKKGEPAFRKVASQKGDMAVLMMDLDHFKKLNDTFGHLTGDKVLATVAQTLSAAFRDVDLFARYGGEEFCAFLPGTEESSAMQIAQQLCKIVESIDWGSEPDNLHVTISIGVAAYDTARHYTFDSFVHSADTALYAAKNAGRNNACLYCSAQDGELDKVLAQNIPFES